LSTSARWSGPPPANLPASDDTRVVSQARNNRLAGLSRSSKSALAHRGRYPSGRCRPISRSSIGIGRSLCCHAAKSSPPDKAPTIGILVEARSRPNTREQEKGSGWPIRRDFQTPVPRLVDLSGTSLHHPRCRIWLVAVAGLTLNLPHDGAPMAILGGGRRFLASLLFGSPADRALRSTHLAPRASQSGTWLRGGSAASCGSEYRAAGGSLVFDPIREPALFRSGRRNVSITSARSSNISIPPGPRR